MEPWRTPALTGYFWEDFHSKPHEVVYYCEWWEDDEQGMFFLRQSKH